MGRSPSCSNENVKKGPWTAEEDNILMEYIQKHGGHGSWRALPKLAGLNRCGKSCRLRWTNYLRPDIKRGQFSDEEERMIINLHSAIGNKWSQIATHLPGRTDNEIKNFWNTHVRKKLVSSGIDPKTHEPLIMNHLNNFLVNYSYLLSSSNITINSPLDSALASLRSYLPLPTPNIQLLQNFWQIINSSSNLFPNAFQENSLSHSSFISQCNGLVSGTNAAYKQDSFTFDNMNVCPQRPVEDFPIDNVGGGLRTEVSLNSTFRNSTLPPDQKLPPLVSANNYESFGVEHMDKTSDFTEPQAATVGTWEDLLANEEDESDDLWKYLIKDL